MPLTHEDVTSKVDGRHWRVVGGRLHATFRTGNFATGYELVGRIAESAEAMDHHPDVDLRYPAVHVALVSHDANALTERDVELAARISAAADDLGVDGAPGAPRALEIAIDVVDADAVRPFWRAVLGYDEGEHGVLSDPEGRDPAVWFQQMDEPRPQRNRIHLDVAVPHDLAEARVQAALDAGGRLVSDRDAPSFWVLADAEGNEACVCTWQDR